MVVVAAVLLIGPGGPVASAQGPATSGRHDGAVRAAAPAPLARPDGRPITLEGGGPAPADMSAASAAPSTAAARDWSGLRPAGLHPTNWYAGDMHVHRSCGGTPVSVESIRDAMIAQDISIVSLQADMGNGEVQDAALDLPRVNGSDDPLSTTDRILHWDAEWHWDATYTSYPHQALGGHLISLGLTEAHQIWDEYTYPILDWAHQQGGISGFVHMQYLGSGFPTALNCCIPIEYPVEVALGAADFVSEDVGGSDSAIQAYYRLLNCGFRPGLCAGTDYPCGQIIGPLVTYGRIPGGLSYDGWVDAIAQGHTVVSRVGTSQFLDLRVNGTAGPGDEISLGAAGDVSVTVDWTAGQSASGTLELVRNGVVVASKTAAAGPGTPDALAATVSFPQSGWLCARVTDGGGHMVHTAAVFVTVAGAPVRVAADAQFYVDWINQLLVNTSPGGVWASYFQEDRAAAQARYQAAKAIYQQIVNGEEIAPFVVTRVPAAGAIDVAIGTTESAVFSEALDPATVTGATCQLKDTAENPIGVTVAYDDLSQKITLTPGSPLAPSTVYTVTLKGGPGGIADLAGTPLAADDVWSFTTATPDVTPPTVAVTVPAAGAGGVAPSTAVTATFSEALNAATVTTATFELRDAIAALVPATVSYNPTTMTATLTPSELLAPGAYTSTLKGGAGAIADLAGSVMAEDYVWSFTVTGFSCPCTVWDPSTVPGMITDPDTRACELGVKFHASVSGYATGIRFYKGPQNTGTHTGSLWTTAGELLATAMFTGETETGWQEVAFSSPVQILANTTYIASYHTSVGHYSGDEDYFQTGVDRGPLRALASGEDGPNGVYALSSTTAFPNLGWNASNYWVDVVFATEVGPDETPPTVVSTAPGGGATGVQTSASVSATFSEALAAATVSSATFELRDGVGAPVGGTVTLGSLGRVATFTPGSALAYTTTYTATLKGGEGGIADLAGKLLAADYVWSFTTRDPPPPPPDEGPGGPILVIAAASNPFGRYFAEVLRTEGFNEFTVTDVSTVTPAVLGGYDVVILGELPLSPGQVTMLSDWVDAGGNLIAMRPDKQLAPLLGLTDAAGTRADAYLLVDTATGPGHGVTGETMQYHGTADLYTLSGATALAMLYSDASTPTTDPAVTLRSVGSNGGQAAAFTFDLARSVVLTRQGNPAWINTERDMDAVNCIRADDMFFGRPTDPPSDPEWVDRNKLHIPQADEQQRLLANCILQMNADRKPLPRFWYFPRGKKAVIVMTGDDHGSGNTAPRFDKYLQQSPSGCSLADWECVRASSYMSPGVNFTPAQAAYYDGLGFEVAVHCNSNCTSYTEATLDNFFTSQIASWRTAVGDIQAPSTHRLHCGAWSDWIAMPKVELLHGMRADMDYYYWVGWPPNWLGSRPGMFTGSGMPMRFADLDGSMIDNYQVTTQMTDESGQAYPFTCDAILDKALGSEGYYGAFCANMHTDYASHASSDVIVEHALARGVPVISGRQLLTWLDGRNSSSFGAVAWNANTLSFTVTAATAARNLETMLPLMVARARLVGLQRDGQPVTFRTETIKGIAYAIFASPSGGYLAAYEEDLTPPAISAVAVVPGIDGTAVVTWTTDEESDSRVAWGTGAEPFGQEVSSASLVTAHQLTLNGLVAGITYRYRVYSKDGMGNEAAYPAPPAEPLSFTTPPGACFVDATAAQFLAGALAGAYVSEHADGEVMLPPAVAAEFSGTVLPTGWSTVVNNPGGTAVVADGRVTFNAAQARTDALYSVGRSLEFEATFRSVSYQAIGFGIDFNTTAWVIFSTNSSGTALQARTYIGSGATFNDVNLSSEYFGSPHRYRIVWQPEHCYFYVDGVLVSTHDVAITADLRVIASDFVADAVAGEMNWMQLSPFGGAGTFTSRVYDAGGPATWDRAYWTAEVPTGTALALSVRHGSTVVPDETWSDFVALPSSGSPIGANSRYLQYRAELSSSDVTSTPVLRDLTAACLAEPEADPPVISAITTETAGYGTSEIVRWTTDEYATSVVAYGTDPNDLSLSASVPGLVVSHAVTLTGLTLNTTYYYRVTSTDATGNAATSPPEGEDPLSFTTPESAPQPCFVDDSAADFGAGAGSGTGVAERDDGELILAPMLNADFAGASLPAGWMQLSWNNPGEGGVTVAGGVAAIDGQRVNPVSLTTVGPGVAMEFWARFEAVTFQGVGFGAGDNSGTTTGLFIASPWALFGTGNGTEVSARSTGSTDTPIPGLTGAFHRYRIDWRSDRIDFYVDGVLKATHVAVAQGMRAGISDASSGGPAVTVDWLRVTPYTSSGSYLSRIYDSGGDASWVTAAWTADTPAGTDLTIRVRTGNAVPPDASWTAFTAVPSSGSALGGHSRYFQYRADLSTADLAVTPQLSDLTITCIAGNDIYPPVISNAAGQVAPTGIEATVTWSTDEPASSRVDYGIDPDDLDLSATAAGLVVQHSVPLTGLALNTTYYYRVTSVDAAANSATSPPGTEAPLSFTTPPAGPQACFDDVVVADFAAGTTGGGTYVAVNSDGEVMLAPAWGEEFSGTSLPSGWTVTNWPSGPSYSVGSGRLSVDACMVEPPTTANPGSALEFVATFGADQFQHVGFETGGNSWSRYAIFSTFDTQTTLYARTFGGGDTPIGLTGLIGSPHRYRIEWDASSVRFYVDGALRVTHNVSLAGPMAPLVTDYNRNSTPLTVDWMRVLPYATAGTFLSRVYDSGTSATWSVATWTAETPAGTGLVMSVRTGNVVPPDGTWSPFVTLSGSGATVGGSSRYAQYRAELSTGNGVATPVLADFHLTCVPGPDITPPVISAVAAVPAADGESATVTWTTNELADSRVDYGVDPDALTLSNVAATRVIAHSATLAGLTPGTTYYYRVTSADEAGNAATDPAPPQAPRSFTTPVPLCASDQTAADFQAGTLTGSYVADLGYGAVLLAPTVGTEFGGTELPAPWLGHVWPLPVPPGAGSVTMGGGVVTCDGARVTTEAPYGAGRSLEFVAHFGKTRYEAVGFVSGNLEPPQEVFNSYPWILISTKDAPDTTLYARTATAAGTTLDIALAPPPSGWFAAPHRFRIDWLTDRVDFYADGALVSSHPVAIATPMRVGASELDAGGPVLRLDWVHLSPYAESGSFVSRVFGDAQPRSWVTATWTSQVPAGTGLVLSVRGGDSPDINDGTWTGFQTLAGSGSAVGLCTRYLQYKADLTTADPASSPVLQGVGVTCLPSAELVAIGDLTAAPATSGHDASGRTKIQLTWTGGGGGGGGVKVYRKGYGDYPLYRAGHGAGPPAPASPAAALSAGWTLVTGVTASGQSDQPPERDYWYYVAFDTDACGNASPVSNRTGGTLDYRLGDVSNGVDPCAGDNLVNMADVSVLGTNYGATIAGPSDPLACLDVGPTVNYPMNSRPQPDGVLEFEDLVLYAMNFTLGGGTGPVATLRREAPEGAAANAVSLTVPVLPGVGETFSVVLHGAGRGDLQALSLTLDYDRAVVEMVKAEPGELLGRQASQAVVLSPRASQVDVALLGEGAALSGEGDLAAVTFRVLAAGDPKLRLAAVDARDGENRKVTVAGAAAAKPALPSVTQLAPARPNPFSQTVTLGFSLAAGGEVDLTVYSVDGRRVRTLVRGVREPGEYETVWDGRDEGGRVARAGVYFARLTTPQGRFTRAVTYLK